jgi:hypothetical protein
VITNARDPGAFARAFLRSGFLAALTAGGFSAFGFGYYAWHPATYAFDVY